MDFHIHTISSGKDYDFTYSSEWMKEYVQKAELDAIAITNHDMFDLENYLQVKEDISNIKIFPGMELSLEEGHVNIVFPEENIDDLVKFSDWLKKQNLGEKGKISTEDFCQNMNNWEKGIYIFELGKSNSLAVPKKLSDVTAVGGVSNQLKFQVIHKKEHLLTPVLFSDAHASLDEPEQKRRNINLLMNKNTFLQIDNCTFTEIKNCISDRSKVGINKENLSNVINIGNHKVSTGLNLIVGKRGTGKTKFLKRVREQYELEEIYAIEQFETAKADEYINEQRKEQGHSNFNNWKKQYASQFSAIRKYLSLPTNDLTKELETYLSSVKNFAKETVASNSKSKYQLIKESNFENKSISNLEEYLISLKKIIGSEDFWSLLKNSSEKKLVFIETYMELRNLYIEKRLNNEIQNRVNVILNSVKDIVESKTGISPVSQCEFAKIIHKNQTEKAINKFMVEIVNEKVLRTENIHGYKIIVKLQPFKNADQFRRDQSTKEAVSDDLMGPYQREDYITFLHNLKKKSFFNISNLEEYILHLDAELLDSDGTPASGGQAVGFALMMRLEQAKNKPIILIDEPEASLDNAYIRQELIKTIKELAIESTVFVVTHNSTLGTLLEPDYLIVTTKSGKDNYHTLSGEFSSHLISEKIGNFESSYEKFVEAMESGIEAYNKKGEIYESLRN